MVQAGAMTPVVNMIGVHQRIGKQVGSDTAMTLVTKNNNFVIINDITLTIILQLQDLKPLLLQLSLDLISKPRYKIVN